MNKIKVTLTKEHKAKSRQYMNRKSCILATALKEMFPDSKIAMGGTFCFINGEMYIFPAYADSVLGCYYPNFKFPITIILTKA